MHYQKIGGYGPLERFSIHEKKILALVDSENHKNKNNARIRYPYTRTDTLPIQAIKETVQGNGTVTHKNCIIVRDIKEKTSFQYFKGVGNETMCVYMIRNIRAQKTLVKIFKNTGTIFRGTTWGNISTAFFTTKVKIKKLCIGIILFSEILLF